MQESQTCLQRPPGRYHPKGLTLLHEDRDILVVDKVSGLLTVSTDKVKDRTAYYLLNEYVRKGNRKSRNRVHIVHRLDRDTSGVIVFAKNVEAKRYLQSEWQGFRKTYYALVHGAPPDTEGVFTSYLAENRAQKVYSVADPKEGKLAKTGYKVLKESPKYTLLEIDLLTGKKNQIRVHLSDCGCPVVGDKKYGVAEKGARRLMLHAAVLTIVHPHSKEWMTFSAEVPALFESLMSESRGTRKGSR